MTQNGESATTCTTAEPHVWEPGINFNDLDQHIRICRGCERVWLVAEQPEPPDDCEFSDDIDWPSDGCGSDW